jgi:hypothetical protein
MRSGAFGVLVVVAVSAAVAVAVAAVGAAGCGAPPHSPTRGDGVNCGGHACGAGLSCCVDYAANPPRYECAASCSAAVLTVACDGPEDCAPTGSRYCCEQSMQLGAAGGGNGCARGGAMQCSPACLDSGRPSSCTGAVTARMCRTASDCDGDLTFHNCCGGAADAWSFCADDAGAAALMAAGGRCL